MPGPLAAAATAAATAAPSATSGVLDGAIQALDENQAQATASCIPGSGTVCGLLQDAGLSQAWAQALTGYGLPVLRVVIIIVVALVVRSVLHRAIGALSERIATGETLPGRGRWWGRRRTDRNGDGPDGAGPDGSTTATATAAAEAPPLGGVAVPPPGGTIAWERRAQRARTIGSVLRSLSTGAVVLVASLLVLGEVGVNLSPLLAGASVVGVAVGFGAQTLVKDLLSGLFLIAEDQFGVGDSVDLGTSAVGTVEAVGLRVTRLRAVDGTVWYVRNGDVVRVGNRSQGWARAVLDVDVGAAEDVPAVEAVLSGVGAGLAADPAWAPQLLDEPQVWGVEALSQDKVVLRLVARTVPLQQWAVARELRARIKAAFDAEGINAPAPPAAPPATAAAPALPAPAVGALPAPAAGGPAGPTGDAAATPRE